MHSPIKYSYLISDMGSDKVRYNFIGALFIILLSQLIIYDAQSPRFMDGQKMIQAIFYLYTITSAIIFILVRYGKVNKVLSISIAVSGLWLLKSIGSNSFNLNWVVGDFLLVTSPIMIAVLVYQKPYLFINRIFWWVVSVSFIASIIAYWFPDISDRNRFEAPSILLISAISYILVSADFKKFRFITIFAYCLIVILAWLSQWRFNFLLTLLCPIFIIGLQYGLGRFSAFFVCLLVAVITILFLSGDWLVTMLAESRFNTFTEGGVTNDGSLMFRVLEARAVIIYCIENWNIFDYIFGGGHGAWFDGGALSILAREEYLANKIFDGQIRIHNIHIGFIAIFYRYGIVGLALLTYVLYKNFIYLFKIRESPIEIRILAVSTFIYILTQLTLYNMSNTLLFTFTVGCFYGAYVLTARSAKF